MNIDTTAMHWTCRIVHDTLLTQARSQSVPDPRPGFRPSLEPSPNRLLGWFSRPMGPPDRALSSWLLGGAAALGGRWRKTCARLSSPPRPAYCPGLIWPCTRNQALSSKFKICSPENNAVEKPGVKITMSRMIASACFSTTRFWLLCQITVWLACVYAGGAPCFGAAASHHWMTKMSAMPAAQRRLESDSASLAMLTAFRWKPMI